MSHRAAGKKFVISLACLSPSPGALLRTHRSFWGKCQWGMCLFLTCGQRPTAGTRRTGEAEAVRKMEAVTSPLPRYPHVVSPTGTNAQSPPAFLRPSSHARRMLVNTMLVLWLLLRWPIPAPKTNTRSLTCAPQPHSCGRPKYQSPVHRCSQWPNGRGRVHARQWMKGRTECDLSTQ